MEQFPVLILTGRPASGKSEIIDYLLHLDPVERLHRFRILDFLIEKRKIKMLYTECRHTPTRLPPVNWMTGGGF